MYVSAGRGVVVCVVDEHTDVDDGRRLGVSGVERGWQCASYITPRGHGGILFFPCRSADVGNLIKKFGLDWKTRV